MPELSRLSFPLLPGCCLLCGTYTRRPRDICLPCERDLPGLGPACARCARPLALNAAHCGDCLKSPPLHDGSLAVFRYDWPLDALVLRFKFTRDLAAGRLLGELFADGIPQRDEWPDCLLPVPLHSHRLRERGFNQAGVLAASLAARLGIMLDDGIVARIRETETQSGMDAVARRRNVRNAFLLRETRLPGHVAIVDDVMTTGSTTTEIARLLRKAGVRTIEVWTLARAVWDR